MAGKSKYTRQEFKGEYDPAEEVRFLRAEVRRLEGQLEKVKQETGMVRILMEDVKEAIKALPPVKRRKGRQRKVSKVSSPVVYVSHWTDWHMGAIQDPAEVEGFGEFSPEILERRIMDCVERQLEWVELHRSNYRIEESVDLVTGDLISGGIHDELLWTNAFPEPVQAIRAGELLARVVARKAAEFKKVVVHFVTVDNHGRLTKRKQHQEAGYNCWGYVIGFYAKERLREHKNVEFNVYPVTQQVVQVSNRRYLLTHGDRVRAWMGFPYYGQERKISREASRRMRRALDEWRKGVLLDDGVEVLFDLLVGGHWHVPMTHCLYWLGGSACGTTAYDHSQGRWAEPSQPSWLVHPKHGEFDRTDWRLR